MATLKPLRPLQFEGQNLYPLTTYDQIIMSNGKKWNGVVGADVVIEPTITSGTKLATVSVDGVSKDLYYQVPTITLNGTATTSANFYAPITAGSAGQVLKSNGSDAPSWITLGSNAYTSTAYIAQSFEGAQYITNTASSGDTSLCLRTNAEDSWLAFKGSETMLGWIGFANVGDLRVDTTSGVYNILHSGNYSSYVKTLTYQNQLTTDEAIDNFNYANSFSATTWNNTSSPGVSNGIILDMAWTSASYGAQIAIDDDPTYYMALRQKDENGWKAWKRIPMADGTGASGTWGISVSGSAYSVRDAGDGRTLTFNYSADGMASATWIAAWNGNCLQGIHKNNLTVGAATKATQDGNGNVISSTYLKLSGGTLTGKLQVNDLIVGYNYTKGGNSVAAFVWDKPGNNWTGIGANAEEDTIYFGACDGSGNWVTNYRQKWKFNGSLIVGGGDDNCNIVPWTNNYSTIGTESLKWWKIYAANIYGDAVYGAVWNDYAEFRTTVPNAKPGQVVIENGDGSLQLSTERLQPGCEIVSDTFGFAIGETDECKTPIAAAGRVLAYPYEDRDTFIAGEAVCSGPNGTVSRMTREEVMMYPERIIGTVSEIPSYERWGTGDVEVNGRIWIRIR